MNTTKYETQVEYDGYVFDVVAKVYYPAHMAEDDLPEVDIIDVSLIDEVKDVEHDMDFFDIIESDHFIEHTKNQIIGDFQ